MKEILRNERGDIILIVKEGQSMDKSDNELLEETDKELRPKITHKKETLRHKKKPTTTQVPDNNQKYKSY